MTDEFIASIYLQVRSQSKKQKKEKNRESKSHPKRRERLKNNRFSPNEILIKNK